MRLLVIQSRTTPARIENERNNFLRSVDDAAEVSFLSSVDEQLSWMIPDEMLRGFDGVIFGGSSDFDFHGGRLESDPARLMSILILARVKNLITYALAEHIPLLGICYGHQLVANLFGGNVMHDKRQNKFGSHEVRLTEEGKCDPLFGRLPEHFFAQYAHKDSVTALPRGATLLATGVSCRFAALRYGPSAFTVQFHPEVVRFRDGPESPEASKLVSLWVQLIEYLPSRRLTGAIAA